MRGEELPGLGDAVRWAAERIDKLDARLLVQHVAGATRADLIARPETPLSAQAWADLQALVARRVAGEPLAYLVQEAEFYGLRLKVSPAVLIPRPETEELVTLSLDKLKGLQAPRVLDLGTGSGAIPIALAVQRPDASITALDQSPEALAVAAANGAAHGCKIRWLESDWYSALGEEGFHLIVSNPPYIADGDPHLALNGLPFEPRSALTDGADGLSCIKAIVAGAGQYLLPDGWLLLEHGHDQAENCRNLLQQAGFKAVFSLTDLSGNDRFSAGQWSG